jgi:hypothetical protein
MTAIDISKFLTLAILQICDGRALFPLFILCSDVTTFKYSSTVNRQDFMYVATENPNATGEQAVVKSTVFWDIMLCNQLKFNRHFGRTYHLNLQVRRMSGTRNQRESKWQAEICLPPASTLKLKATFSSAKSLLFQRTTQHYIPEDSSLLFIALTVRTSNPTQLSADVPGTAVWCGVSSRRMLGRFFFQATVTGTPYVTPLEDNIPCLNILFYEEGCPFKYDGAPPHDDTNVRHF